MCPDTQIFIDGVWRQGSGSRSLAVPNPVSTKRIGAVACAGIAEALTAAAKGFGIWHGVQA